LPELPAVPTGHGNIRGNGDCGFISRGAASRSAFVAAARTERERRGVNCFRPAVLSCRAVTLSGPVSSYFCGQCISTTKNLPIGGRSSRVALHRQRVGSTTRPSARNRHVARSLECGDTRFPFSGADIAVPVTVAFGDRDWILPKGSQRRTELPPHTTWIKSKAGVMCQCGSIQSVSHNLFWRIPGSA
jgi:pimeloyl-ACP methyl ester carboxylesterase